MKVLSCKKVKKLAGDYSQNLLLPDLVHQIEAHISECPFCKMAHEETLEVLDLLNRDRLPDSGPDFWNGLSSRVMTQVRLNRSDSIKVPWHKTVWESPFKWPGYAWVTALILILLTPAVIYNNYSKGYKPASVQESLENEWKWGIGTESYSSAIESLSPKESLRLRERITARMGKELPIQTHGLLEDDLQWDVSPVLESLTPQELDAVIKKSRPGGSAGFEEGMSYVS